MMTASGSAKEAGRFAAPLGALGFLTVLPIPAGAVPAGHDLGRSVAYFPLIGALLGTIVAIADLALGQILPRPIISALDLAILALLTGALHLDGLMDSCDGLFGRSSPAGRLAIMRDSRVGSYGVVGGVLVLLIQFSCLVELGGWIRFSSLFAMVVMSRWAMSYAIGAYPYARPEGLGSAFTKTISGRDIAFATVLAGVAALLAVGPAGLLLLGIGWVGVRLLAAFAVARLGGLTGDTYGAINEIIGASVLLAIVAGQPLFGATWPLAG